VSITAAGDDAGCVIRLGALVVVVAVGVERLDPTVPLFMLLPAGLVLLPVSRRDAIPTSLPPPVVTSTPSSVILRTKLLSR